MTALTNEEYEQRKHFLEDLKTISKTESAKIFEVLRKNNVEYSENSNGIFFDLSRVSQEAFNEIQKFIVFCQENRKEFELRDRAMENSRLNLGEATSIV